MRSSPNSACCARSCVVRIRPLHGSRHGRPRRSSAPSPLDGLVGTFGLSDCERALLLLGAGQELISAVGAELAAATGSATPTLGSALGVLPDAHWSVLAPGAPLRHWELVRLDDPVAPARSAFVVDERIVNYLVGVSGADARLRHLIRPAQDPMPLPGPLRAVANELAVVWTSGLSYCGGTNPTIAAPLRRRCREGGHAPVRGRRSRPADGPGRACAGAPAARPRDQACDRAWLVTLDDVAPENSARIARAAASLEGKVVLLAGGRGGTVGAVPDQRWGCSVVEVPRLDLEARAELLDTALHCAGASTDRLDAVAGVFDLTVAEAYDVARDVAAGGELWAASRIRSRAAAGGVARRIEPRATWSGPGAPRRADLPAAQSRLRRPSSGPGAGSLGVRPAHLARTRYRVPLRGAAAPARRSRPRSSPTNSSSTCCMST